MALTTKKIPVGKYSFFEYYNTGVTTAATSLDESLNPATPFTLDTVRLHLSVAVVSTVDFRIYVSSVLGSAHNLVLLSHAMNGVQDIFWGPDREMVLNKGDQVVMSLILSDNGAGSGNVFGLNVTGWTIIE